MNKKKLLVVLGTLLLIIFWWILKNRTYENNSLIDPSNSKVSQLNPTSLPSPTPKSFRFDKNTDLEKELESINPEVLESDFGE